jgi:hypothetical protein
MRPVQDPRALLERYVADAQAQRLSASRTHEAHEATRAAQFRPIANALESLAAAGVRIEAETGPQPLPAPAGSNAYYELRLRDAQLRIWSHPDGRSMWLIELRQAGHPRCRMWQYRTPESAVAAFLRQLAPYVAELPARSARALG